MFCYNCNNFCLLNFISSPLCQSFWPLWTFALTCVNLLKCRRAKTRLGTRKMNFSRIITSRSFCLCGVGLSTVSQPIHENGWDTGWTIATGLEQGRLVSVDNISVVQLKNIHCDARKRQTKEKQVDAVTLATDRISVEHASFNRIREIATMCTQTNTM